MNCFELLNKEMQEFIDRKKKELKVHFATNVGHFRAAELDSLRSGYATHPIAPHVRCRHIPS
jgi:hypothetical protein